MRYEESRTIRKISLIILLGFLVTAFTPIIKAEPLKPILGEFTAVSKPKELSSWSLSAHAGVNNPTGSFGNSYDSGTSFGLDLEYLFNSNYAMELFLGIDNFDGVVGIQDTDIFHLSMNGKRYFTHSIHRYFVQAGFGSYDFDPGTTEFGYNIGAGFQWNQTLHLAFEVTAKYHSIDTSGDSSDFSILHVGVRHRF